MSRHEKSYRLLSLCWLCEGKPLESGFACPECSGTGEIEDCHEDVAERAIRVAVAARQTETKSAGDGRRS